MDISNDLTNRYMCLEIDCAIALSKHNLARKSVRQLRGTVKGMSFLNDMVDTEVEINRIWEK
ncbi:hypothetical protein, partial [Herbiconiux daphne]